MRGVETEAGTTDAAAESARAARESVVAATKRWSNVEHLKWSLAGIGDACRQRAVHGGVAVWGGDVRGRRSALWDRLQGEGLLAGSFLLKEAMLTSGSRLKRRIVVVSRLRPGKGLLASSPP